MAVEIYRTAAAANSSRQEEPPTRPRMLSWRQRRRILRRRESMAILNSMASKVIRATYALDAETVRLLSDLAERQGTSKSEAIRRAVRLAAERAAEEEEDPAAVLKAFQQELALTPESAAEWIAEIRAERNAGRGHAR